MHTSQLINSNNMHRVSNILSLTFLLLHSLSEGCQWSMEAEQGNTNGNKTDRGGASNKQTVKLYSEGQYIIWDDQSLITESSCKLRVLNVEYTNDGRSDTLALYVDGQLVRSFDTKAQTNHGHLWNEPVTSGPIGDEIILSTGNHTIKLVATTVDEYGIEVDRIILELICTDGKCSTFQVPDLTSNDDSWSRGHVIAVAIGVPSLFLTLIGVIIGVITLIKRSETS